MYLEQQFGKITLRTGFVYNNLIDIAGVVNAGRPRSAYTTPVTFYVPNSANVATASSPTVTLWNLAPALTGPSVQVYENLPENSHFYNWELTGIKRMGSRWTLMGSFNYTWNYVRNYTSGFGTGSSFTPNQLMNTAGCT